MELENCDVKIKSIEIELYEVTQLRDLFKNVAEFRGALIYSKMEPGLNPSEKLINKEI